METRIFHHCTGDAAEILKKGGLVGVPTETVYGLAGNGLDKEAVERIYEVKGRPPKKPLSLMIPDAESMGCYASEMPGAAVCLAKKFWPGPLTIVLKAKKTIPEIVLAGGKTVGLRCPDNKLTLQLLQEAGIPFAVPSANISGEKSPTDVEDVLAAFDGIIEAVIDGGPCTLGRESTIIDMSETPYRILRQGALAEEEITNALISHLQVIGITGMSGSGKTSALEVFRTCDALVIDCDEVYHELLEQSDKMKGELSERFPKAFEKGKLNRRILARAVFDNEVELNALNRITHRYVAEEVYRRLGRFAMDGGETAAIDAVELISSPLREMCDLTLAVVASEEKRIERIINRDGITREEAERRVRAQKSEAYYRENCSFTIENDKTPEEFQRKIESIWREFHYE